MAASNTLAANASIDREAARALERKHAPRLGRHARPHMLGCRTSEQTGQALRCRYRMCVPFRATRKGSGICLEA